MAAMMKFPSGSLGLELEAARRTYDEMGATKGFGIRIRSWKSNVSDKQMANFLGKEILGKVITAIDGSSIELTEFKKAVEILRKSSTRIVRLAEMNLDNDSGIMDRSADVLSVCTAVSNYSKCSESIYGNISCSFIYSPNSELMGLGIDSEIKERNTRVNTVDDTRGSSTTDCADLIGSETSGDKDVDAVLSCPPSDNSAYAGEDKDEVCSEGAYSPLRMNHALLAASVCPSVCPVTPAEQVLMPQKPSNSEESPKSTITRLLQKQRTQDGVILMLSGQADRRKQLLMGAQEQAQKIADQLQEKVTEVDTLKEQVGKLKGDIKGSHGEIALLRFQLMKAKDTVETAVISQNSMGLSVAPKDQLSPSRIVDRQAWLLHYNKSQKVCNHLLQRVFINVEAASQVEQQTSSSRRQSASSNSIAKTGIDNESSGAHQEVQLASFASGEEENVETIANAKLLHQLQVQERLNQRLVQQLKAWVEAQVSVQRQLAEADVREGCIPTKVEMTSCAEFDIYEFQADCLGQAAGQADSSSSNSSVKKSIVKEASTLLKLEAACGLEQEKPNQQIHCLQQKEQKHECRARSEDTVPKVSIQGSSSSSCCSSDNSAGNSGNLAWEVSSFLASLRAAKKQQSPSPSPSPSRKLRHAVQTSPRGSPQGSPLLLSFKTAQGDKDRLDVSPSMISFRDPIESLHVTGARATSPIDTNARVSPSYSLGLVERSLHSQLTAYYPYSAVHAAMKSPEQDKKEDAYQGCGSNGTSKGLYSPPSSVHCNAAEHRDSSQASVASVPVALTTTATVTTTASPRSKGYKSQLSPHATSTEKVVTHCLSSPVNVATNLKPSHEAAVRAAAAASVGNRSASQAAGAVSSENSVESEGSNQSSRRSSGRSSGNSFSSDRSTQKLMRSLLTVMPAKLDSSLIAAPYSTHGVSSSEKLAAGTSKGDRSGNSSGSQNRSQRQQQWGYAGDDIISAGATAVIAAARAEAADRAAQVSAALVSAAVSSAASALAGVGSGAAALPSAGASYYFTHDNGTAAAAAQESPATRIPPRNLFAGPPSPESPLLQQQQHQQVQQKQEQQHQIIQPHANNAAMPSFTSGGTRQHSSGPLSSSQQQLSTEYTSQDTHFRLVEVPRSIVEDAMLRQQPEQKSSEYMPVHERSAIYRQDYAERVSRSGPNYVNGPSDYGQFSPAFVENRSDELGRKSGSGRSSSQQRHQASVVRSEGADQLPQMRMHTAAEDADPSLDRGYGESKQQSSLGHSSNPHSRSESRGNPRSESHCHSRQDRRDVEDHRAEEEGRRSSSSNEHRNSRTARKETATAASRDDPPPRRSDSRSRRRTADDDNLPRKSRSDHHAHAQDRVHDPTRDSLSDHAHTQEDADKLKLRMHKKFAEPPVLKAYSLSDRPRRHRSSRSRSRGAEGHGRSSSRSRKHDPQSSSSNAPGEAKAVDENVREGSDGERLMMQARQNESLLRPVDGEVETTRREYGGSRTRSSSRNRSQAAPDALNNVGPAYPTGYATLHSEQEAIHGGSFLMATQQQMLQQQQQQMLQQQQQPGQRGHSPGGYQSLGAANISQNSNRTERPQDSSKPSVHSANISATVGDAAHEVRAAWEAWTSSGIIHCNNENVVNSSNSIISNTKFAPVPVSAVGGGIFGSSADELSEIHSHANTQSFLQFQQSSAGLSPTLSRKYNYATQMYPAATSSAYSYGYSGGSYPGGQMGTATGFMASKPPVSLAILSPASFKDQMSRLRQENSTIRDDIMRFRGNLRKLREECSGAPSMAYTETFAYGLPVKRSDLSMSSAAGSLVAPAAGYALNSSLAARL